MRHVLLPILVLMSPLGCSGESGNDDPNESGSTGGQSNGGEPPVSDEAACQDYRREYCDYVISCGLVSGAASDCEAELDTYVDCRSARLASECAATFPSASCREFPAGCEPPAVADTTEAVATCEAFQDALCTSSVACGDDYDLCRQVLATDLPCGAVVAVLKDPQPCLDAIANLACEDPLPESCVELLL